MEQIIFRIASSSDYLQARQLCYNNYRRMGYIDEGSPIPTTCAGLKTCMVALDHRKVVGTVTLTKVVSSGIFEPWNGKLYSSCLMLVGNAFQSQSFSIGSLAVEKDYAAARISCGLYRMAYEWALRHNLTYAFITMDVRAFRALKLSGWYAVQVGEPMWYLGSPSVPAIIPILEQTKTTTEPTKAHPFNRTFHTAAAL